MTVHRRPSKARKKYRPPATGKPMTAVVLLIRNGKVLTVLSRRLPQHVVSVTKPDLICRSAPTSASATARGPRLKFSSTQHLMTCQTVFLAAQHRRCSGATRTTSDANRTFGLLAACHMHAASSRQRVVQNRCSICNFNVECHALFFVTYFQTIQCAESFQHPSLPTHTQHSQP